MSTKLTVAMALTRKAVLLKVESQAGPLSDLIAQVYLFGNTQTLNHWRKELRSIVLIVVRNLKYHNNKFLKETDVVNALDGLADNRNISFTVKTLLKDDDYKTLVPRKETLFSEDQAFQLLATLASSVFQDTDAWSVSDELIKQILEW